MKYKGSKINILADKFTLVGDKATLIVFLRASGGSSKWCCSTTSIFATSTKQNFYKKNLERKTLFKNFF